MSDEPISEEWQFMGDRLHSTGKLVNAWSTPDGVDALVDFRCKAAVGAVFTIERLPGDKFRMGGYVRHETPLERWVRETFLARDAAARARVLRRVAREALAGDESSIDAWTIADARRQVAACRNHAERSAMLAVILGRLT